ncbi:MAG: 1-deoxy-D-xylulose-5-phosphate reductoisomerase [Alphaproteobacteria bacterium]|nr:1-deoxy-D-xylulose-5-phosphate reductoisomerase [Alphaproteobacteria bacterium]
MGAVVTRRNSKRRVTVLGSTGSVGANTVDLIERRRSADDEFAVVALTAHSNVHVLSEQARRLRPEVAVVAEPNCYGALKEELSGTGIEVAAGAVAVEEAARRTTDWTMASIVGAAGLKPALAAVAQGRTVALANKECLVSAGTHFMAQVKASGARLLPVDSEHSAVFQVFDFAQLDKIERVTLTASGGPFRTWTLEQMAKASAAQACKHPNWSMGAKISVDSATLMNKGLELIEAHFLFGISPERLDVVVHPQSIVHSLVSYVDGSVLAQLASPDMRTPIAYALGFPERMDAPTARLDLAAIGQLTFEAPDPVRFPCLGLAQLALRAGGAAPTILNAANEVAVEAFLAGQIGFLDIGRTVETALDRSASVGSPSVTSLDDFVSIDAEARAVARRLIGSLQ